MIRRGFICTILLACLLFSAFGTIAAEGGAPLQPDKPATAARFSVNGNGTVTDNRTGLTWLRDADCFGIHDWDTAASLASSLASGQCGLNDGSKPGQWRLPSRIELDGLVNHKLYNSADWLNHQGFVKVNDNFYWTSTESDFSSSKAWYVDMRFGGAFKSDISTEYRVWPVRDGQQHP